MRDCESMSAVWSDELEEETDFHRRVYMSLSARENGREREHVSVFTSTPKGWTERSTLRGHQNDYVSYEDVSVLAEWLKLEHSRVRILTSRTEARDLLEKREHLSSPPNSFLSGIPGDEEERADAVLRHLERGW